MEEKNYKGRKKLEDGIEKVRKGEFVPDREDDELTLALGNPEHDGRCRGRGADVNKYQGFPADVETYRKRFRNKKKELDRFTALEQQVKGFQEQLNALTQTRESQQLVVQDPAVDAAPSQRKSSVGSTQLEDPAVEPPAAHYPMDDMTEKTNCVLHMPMKNISFPVADGYALPNQPGAIFHFAPIPAGYARVGVKTVMPGFHSVDLDNPGCDDEKTDRKSVV